MSTFSDTVYQHGGSPVGSGLPAVCSLGGKWLWVDPVNGSDANSGKSPKRAMASLIAAEDLLTANRHDGIFLIGGATANTLTQALVWDKSYTHLVGVNAQTMYGNRVRVLTSTTALTPFITVSGNGCVFHNIMFSEEGSHATNSAVCLYITGARNSFSYVTARTIGALAVVDASKRDLKINSSNGENYFYRCTFGSDSYDGSANAANYVCEFTASAETARNVFDECLFLGSGSSGAAFIIAGTSATTSVNWFKRCLFFNNDLGTMNAMTQGFNIGSGNGYFVMQDCLSWGFTNAETSDSSLIITNPAPAAATGIKGVVLTV